MSLKNKLSRLKPHIARGKMDSLPEGEVSLIPANQKKEIPFLSVWEKEGVQPYYFDDNFCLVREVHYPITHQHGRYSFKAFLEAMSHWQAFSGSHPLSAKGFKPSDLFFFDTETTGLGGGAGNTIFLLGYAFFRQDKIILKQHILYEPGSEVPLYQSFLENINYTTLVTYNGKAFDWPQVKTRHTLVREHVPRLPQFGHFDLFHASRRLWKDRMKSVKLSNVEKEILKFERDGDIPGFLAPIIYFDFVERKDPEGLLGVIKHNEHDILSLITLYTHLTFQILQKDPGQTTVEKRLIGKWFHYIGEEETAVAALKEAADEQDLPAKHDLAFHLKRAGQYEEAGKLWLEVSESGERPIQKEACIELAKLYEHQFKELKKALDYTSLALAINDAEINEPLKPRLRFKKDAEKRKARLQRKGK
ncbi:ribonuclease H-like domain-containing protein [Heyndrickxia acidicola]|uniref:Ribonuclease H-like domain-containing protein n=1 Tax=Heyndrickxia acidicola TaxID=209389 RepID=A0ABU6MM34_9BACI|nr:ribonuclease H-like domain-containing protein [Heyndrickxia acidicola]MED1205041.1 ribonuclease H-like domain-containing protein [Heyndrickxia acidicola]